jgi:hypothetical protein
MVSRQETVVVEEVISDSSSPALNGRAFSKLGLALPLTGMDSDGVTVDEQAIPLKEISKKGVLSL